MGINMNKLPKGRVLPETFKGKKPLHVAQMVVGDDHDEPEYKVLCEDGTYVLIPLAEFPAEPKKEEATNTKEEGQ